MPHGHLVAATTQTVELHQIHEISSRLAELHPARVTAGMLGVDGKQTASSHWHLFDLFDAISSSHQNLRPTAILDHVSADGCPEFPYIHGHFLPEAAANRDNLVVELHTEALRRLSHALGLQHRWGNTSAKE